MNNLGKYINDSLKLQDDHLDLSIKVSINPVRECVL